MTDTAFDFKKEYRDLYHPKTTPMLIDVPPMNFLMVAGHGDPNEEDGAYAEALSLLYGFSFTVKMAKKGDWQPDGYFDYVVPPLEGLWWTDDDGFDGTRIVDKGALNWISMIRQPSFVTPDVFAWARDKLTAKKPELDVRRARLETYHEGLCVQAMHRGPYDDEPATIEKMEVFAVESGHVIDIAVPSGLTSAEDIFPAPRLHHEIYLGDPLRTKPENLRTVIRHPVKPA